MKCPRCQNEVARLITPKFLCATCTQIDQATDVRPVSGRLSHLDPDAGVGASIRGEGGPVAAVKTKPILAAKLKKVCRFCGFERKRRGKCEKCGKDGRAGNGGSRTPKRPAKRRGPSRDSEIRPIRAYTPRQKPDCDLSEMHFKPGDQIGVPNGVEPVASDDAKGELPEKDLRLALNAAQWREVRKILVRGFHGNTVEEVCLRLLDSVLEKRL